MIVTPGDEAELEALVADAASGGKPLAVAGGGTRAGLGRPVDAETTVATSALTGVTLYEPAELVVSARSGTPLSEVTAQLAENGQMLPFEPMDHRGVLGSDGAPTIGGVAAANVSGPRRIEAGAARDALIGARVVTGRGETVKSGGRVMKNVTGYDLARFLAGSWGTLGVLSEVTFRVSPAAETEQTLVVAVPSIDSAVQAMSAALGSPYAVSGAACRPQEGGPSHVLLRLEGFEASVAQRVDRLTALLRRAGNIDAVSADASRDIWRDVRDAAVIRDAADALVWRLSLKPTAAPGVIAALAPLAPKALLLDWGGGLVWVALPSDTAGAGADKVRAATRQAGGHATLVRAPEDIRRTVDVFEPPVPAVMALTRSMKSTFDPAGILNPGRMYAGV